MTASARPIAVHRWWGTRGPDTCELRPVSCDLRPASCMLHAAKESLQRTCRPPRLAYAVTPPSGPRPLACPAIYQVVYQSTTAGPIYCSDLRTAARRPRRTSCVIQTQLAASQQRCCCVHKKKYALSCARPVVISPCQLHRRESSITGSTRNPSFLGKIKVMTAECNNLRTVPAARCMSRIGNGRLMDRGPSSWGSHVGSRHCRPSMGDC